MHEHHRNSPTLNHSFLPASHPTNTITATINRTTRIISNPVKPPTVILSEP